MRILVELDAEGVGIGDRRLAELFETLVDDGLDLLVAHPGQQGLLRSAGVERRLPAGFDREAQGVVALHPLEAHRAVASVVERRQENRLAGLGGQLLEHADAGAAQVHRSAGVTPELEGRRSESKPLREVVACDVAVPAKRGEDAMDRRDRKVAGVGRLGCRPLGPVDAEQPEDREGAIEQLGPGLGIVGVAGCGVRVGELPIGHSRLLFPDDDHTLFGHLGHGVVGTLAGVARLLRPPVRHLINTERRRLVDGNAAEVEAVRLPGGPC